VIRRWPQPQDTILAEDELSEIGRWVQREPRAGRIAELAATLAQDPEIITDDDRLRVVPGLYETLADLAILVVPSGGEDEAEEPALAGKGVLRVAARYSGEPVDRRNRLTDGRLAVARMIGIDSDARAAHLGLIELANTLCRPVEPLCPACPLQTLCPSSQVGAPRLF
jgi:DNA (cytosine-5)-methyltransferase 1